MLHPVTGEQTRESLDPTPTSAPRLSSVLRTAVFLLCSGAAAAGEKQTVPDLPVSAIAPHNTAIQDVKVTARNWDWDHNKALYKLSDEKRRVICAALYKIAGSKHPNAPKRDDEFPASPLEAWQTFDVVQRLKLGENKGTFDSESVEGVVAALQEVSDVTRIAAK